MKDGTRLVELVVNGQVAAKQTVPADGKTHDLKFEVPIARSSWVALRHFPQLHTNPVNVLVAGKSIRASRDSALWCAESVKILWKTGTASSRNPSSPQPRRPTTAPRKSTNALPRSRRD